MKFVTQDNKPEGPKTITLKQSGDGVYVCVDGKMIAWFDPEDASLSVSRSILRSHGLKLYTQP